MNTATRAMLVARGGLDVLLPHCAHVRVGMDVLALDDDWRERMSRRA